MAVTEIVYMRFDYFRHQSRMLSGYIEFGWFTVSVALFLKLSSEIDELILVDDAHIARSRKHGAHRNPPVWLQPRQRVEFYWGVNMGADLTGRHKKLGRE